MEALHVLAALLQDNVAQVRGLEARSGLRARAGVNGRWHRESGEVVAGGGAARARRTMWHRCREKNEWAAGGLEQESMELMQTQTQDRVCVWGGGSKSCTRGQCRCRTKYTRSRRHMAVWWDWTCYRAI